MTNVVMVIQKSLNYFTWTVTPHLDAVQVSKPFSFQSMNCVFQISLDYHHDYSYKPPFNLYFKSDKELQSPLRVIVSTDSLSPGNFCTQANSITSSNQIIWSLNVNLAGKLMTFEVIIFHDHDMKSKTMTIDKSMQVSAYKDAYFSMGSLSHDFSNLLEEGPNYDVEFMCGDQIIKAHKIILSCRSKIFASMLQSDMVEGKTGRVNIHDIDPIIFRQFLKCLYTGVLPELTIDSAFQLYEASDKYGTDALRKQCADYLTDNLSIENACDILLLSDRHSDADFKENVMKYVIKEKIPYTGDKWMDFCKENPVLAVEILNSFCQIFKSKISGQDLIVW